MSVTHANPFTTMRQNIEAALEDSPDLIELSVAVRKWDETRKQWLDNPAADRQTWLRVETVGIEYNPFWSNNVVEMVHRLRLVCALPVQRGLKQEDIEQLAYAIMRALTPLTRDTVETPVSSFVRLVYRAGSIGVMDSEQPDRADAMGGMVWSQVGDIEVLYQDSVDNMTTEIEEPEPGP